MNRRLFASIPAILSVFFLCSCGNSASNSREEAPVEKLQYAARVNAMFQSKRTFTTKTQ